jgi:hypothetical protein
LDIDNLNGKVEYYQYLGGFRNKTIPLDSINLTAKLTEKKSISLQSQFALAEIVGILAFHTSEAVLKSISKYYQITPSKKLVIQLHKILRFC